MNELIKNTLISHRGSQFLHLIIDANIDYTGDPTDFVHRAGNCPSGNFLIDNLIYLGENADEKDASLFISTHIKHGKKIKKDIKRYSDEAYNILNKLHWYDISSVIEECFNSIQTKWRRNQSLFNDKMDDYSKDWKEFIECDSAKFIRTWKYNLELGINNIGMSGGYVTMAKLVRAFNQHYCKILIYERNLERAYKIITPSVKKEAEKYGKSYKRNKEKI